MDREKAKEELHHYRVTSQNLHIDKLLEDLEELEEELEELSSIPDDYVIDTIKARVRNLEDDHCDDDHVQCGGDVPECVSHLFVCDGHDDCKDGEDEDDYVCSNEPFKVGATISGITSWTDCFSHLPHMTVVTITANHKPEFYTSRTYLRGVVSFEVDEHSHLVKSFSAKGYWNPGKRLMVLAPDEHSKDSAYGYAVVCRFNRGTHDEADCKIGTIASKHECATFRGSRD